MARLFPLLFAFVALLIVVIARERAARTRSDRVYRPHADRRTSRRGFAADAAAGTNWVTPRADLAGVRDAYSSAAIDPDRPLYRCGGCQSFYHHASMQTLRADNMGRCALCGSPDIRSVQVS